MVLQSLIDSGVSEVVLAPGSRNAPLSFAAYDAAAAGLVRLHTRIDERTAGFLALGLTKVGARAAVICTSGTAVANLHPAVLEAAHAGSPAGRGHRRPPGPAPRHRSQPDHRPGRHLRSAGADHGRRRRPTGCWCSAEGPVHLNVQLDDPLVPEDRWTPRGSMPSGRARHAAAIDAHPIVSGPRTVVVAGDDAGPPARTFAERANWPLFAEPSSGSRNGANALRCYRLLLDGDLGRRIERVVVAGHPTLSRPVTRLLGRDDVEVLATPVHRCLGGAARSRATHDRRADG